MREMFSYSVSFTFYNICLFKNRLYIYTHACNVFMCIYMHTHIHIPQIKNKEESDFWYSGCGALDSISPVHTIRIRVLRSP